MGTSEIHTHEDDSAPPVALQVRAERLAGLHSLVRLPAAMGAVFSLLPVLLLWRHLDSAELLCWLAARWAISTWRFLEARRFLRLPLTTTLRSLPRWENRFLAALLLDGLAWGLVGALFATPNLPEIDGAVMTTLVGLAAFTQMSLGAWARAQALFASLVFAPLILRLALQGGSVAWLSAGALIMFWLLTTLESRRIEARTLELLRLRFEQARLAEQSQLALHAAEETSSSKSRFVAVMSHEIRTPLNGILGMAQLLERSDLSDQQREQVDIVRRSGRHLLSLVNDILDLARIESGKLVVDAHSVDVREVVGDVCRLLGATARAKGLSFDWRLSPQLPARAMGDASRIQQVLHNLVGNAIKFTDKGSVTVDVSTLLDMRAGILLRFAVQDSGEGIAADQLERIFAPFEQVAAGQARRRDGTGLGLTISRELARAMGGDLRCSSTPGRGSVFEFTLPLHPVASAEAHRESSTAHPVRGQGTIQPQAEAPHPSPAPHAGAAPPPLPQLQGRVLLVDDSPVNLLVASTMLQRCGLAVEAAENGRQAIEKLRGQAFDLVLMDCQMPELDGFGATTAWRQEERNRQLPRTPIVALTASAVNDDRERCMASGMDDYLVKPFELEDLLAVVTPHLPANDGGPLLTPGSGLEPGAVSGSVSGSAGRHPSPLPSPPDRTASVVSSALAQTASQTGPRAA
ncbi:ATP-binding protein [Roseateles amylovorans]|uniref:histidine kinase n=1 Tax=Roseateles amylovorans TaxID=2978473 RepID=A0ABY6B5M7_9BURK|nr:ATP-binding protein [Roseateles amylovorans]UXH80469.1 ATP-binding protein [Roseateles amylovorans]